MEKVSLEDFYTKTPLEGGRGKFDQLSKMSHFNIFKRDTLKCVNSNLGKLHRTDFYKISLVVGEGRLRFKDQVIEVSGQALVFYNPKTPHSWEAVSEHQSGYFCLFNDKFIQSYLLTEGFKDSALSNPDVNPVFHLTQTEAHYFTHLFKRMYDELDSSYEYKYDIILHNLLILIHEASKRRIFKSKVEKTANASLTITAKFMEILERQFPIDSSEHTINMKKPSDFADQLSVHVNHLNRAVNETTGKSTSEIISTRVVSEAMALLKHSSNSVSEIAYTLGFEHPSNFNLFFKKHAALSPRAFRNLN
ncbi:AraC family transcriptional regulator [Arcticibacterium luteifluviistationis]|uniref:AraC family transcriptional regulator n=1 Tax=Arcticibacterium luteifluviistationis TaxID=1784714 RepID=A0A2Z4GGH9_9BACT|nr:helix-turn-helix transcriptional regulator [Arcticibacterium luteifluviistationis]AWW00381.1 AraC family transcriptional regulator [Arcticibacterium luteifluviistationis]